MARAHHCGVLPHDADPHPNAAYKIGSLVKKGYVEKIQSTTDRREYNLRPTQKYIDYYNISYSYLHRSGSAPRAFLPPRTAQSWKRCSPS